MTSESVEAAFERWARFAAELVALRDAGASPEILSAFRRRETKLDPMLFALVYLSKHLTDVETGKVTLSSVHVEWAESARRWADGPAGPMEDRRLEAAPREMGKSTWHFVILPLWGAAHGHVRFCAAFADAGTQAETHLASFKSELDNNPLIRADFPDLVAPKTRGRGTVEADRVSLYHARSGFVFAAAGMDSRNLGLKVGDARPDLIVLDDIEPHEGAYSAALAEKRRDTLVSAILPLNIRARVVIVGTVTMLGSIIHQIIRYGRGELDDLNTWVGDERIIARHVTPFEVGDDGERRSVWPAKWPLAWLESVEHTRQFAKNYLNDPLGADGDYWTSDDFRPLSPELELAITHEVISLDPAVTTKSSSDYTGIAAVGWARAAAKCALFESRQVKLSGKEIRRVVLGFIERALERGHAVIVIVESNQGGELWTEILHDLPVRVKTYTAGTASKNVRAAEALHYYQTKRVEHAPGNRDAEGQMVAFPRAPHDDLVDAVGAGVRYFLTPRKKGVKVAASSQAYA
ncbi:terminase large subunit [Microbacterium phage OscarSo]|uniref:Terminase large subunit n=1 Tax=Microbacterium phage OscarSo TaxID=2985324 RepID=A0A9X9K3Q6_9CAUD|nr:terminase large subunit [Microbacterium phage OscarSo]UYL87127.1 terminase large subunit [Microbacterium phage OscarSo]